MSKETLNNSNLVNISSSNLETYIKTDSNNFLNEIKNDNLKEKKQSPFSNLIIYFKISSDSEKKMMIIGLICSILSGITFPLFIYYIGKLINVISATDEHKKEIFFKDFMKSHQRKIDENINIILLIGFITMFFHFFFTFFLKLVSLYQIQKIKKYFFELLFKKKINVIQENKELIGKVLLDKFKNIEEGNCYIIGKLFEIISQTFVFLFISIFHSWKLCLMVLFVSPLIFFFEFFFIDDVKHNNKKINENQEKINLYMKEIIDNIITISTFANFEYEIEKYQNLENQNFSIKKINSFYYSFSLSGIASFISFSYCFGILYGKRLITDGDLNTYTQNEIDSGDIFFITISTIISVLSVSKIIDFYFKINKSSNSLFDYIIKEKKNDNYNIIPGEDLIEEAKFNINEGEIKFDNVTFSFDNTSFNNINCLFEKGKKNVIVGKKESGKTTILDLIIGLHEIKSGTINIDNININHFSKKTLSNRISYIKQNPKILKASFRENIILNRTIYSDNLIKTCELTNLKNMILSSDLKYETIPNKNLTLSQLKRIEIARAILSNPKIILIDEIDSNVDKNDNELNEAIENLFNLKNCTFIIVSKNLNTIKNADNIFYVEKGNLIQYGNIEEMKNCEEYNLLIENYEKEEMKKNLKNEYENLFKNESNQVVNYLKKEEFKSNENNFVFNQIILFIGKYLFKTVISIIGIFFNGLCIALKYFIFSKSIIALSDTMIGDLEDNTMICACVFILLSIFHFAFSFIDTFFFEYLINLFCLEYKNKIFSKFFMVPLSYFNFNSNCYKYQIKYKEIKYIFNCFFRNCIKSFGVFIICFPISFYFEWKITLMSIVMSIFYLLSYLFYLKCSNQLLNLYIEPEKEKKYIYHICNDIKTIQSYYYNQKASENYENLLKKNNSEIIKIYVKQSIIKLLNILIFTSLFYIVVHFSGYLIKNYHLSFSDFYVSLTLIYCLTINLKPIIFLFINFKEMKKLLEKNLSILTEENQLNLSEEKSDKKIIEELKGRIEFINVTFYDPIYPSEKILNNISFVIEEGKKICIVGLDNKAKEYIFYLICGLYHPNEGEILIDGDNILKYNIINLRKKIGLLMKNKTLIFNNSLYNNISYGNLKKEKEEIYEISKICDISNLIYEDTIIKNNNVSLDLEQKINLTRIMVKSPQILLIDGDYIKDEELKGKLNNFMKNITCITILNTINKESIKLYDLILLIHNGHLIEQGTHEELKLKNDKYLKYISFASLDN